MDLASSAGGLNSMYALSSTGDGLQHWIATGGMLAVSGDFPVYRHR